MRARRPPTAAQTSIRCRRRDLAPKLPASRNHRRQIMGKYVLAWLLGVPAIVLVVIYFFFH
jgi:hypothetical protein